MERAGDTALLQNIHRLDLLAFGWCHRRSAEAVVFVAARWMSRSADGWLYLLLALLFTASGAIDAMAFVTLGCQAFTLERTAYLLTKNTCRRRRPPDILPGFRSLVIASDRFSFPSGHTLHAVVFSLVATTYYPVLGWLVWPFTALVATSRLVLGLHYVSDVLVGALLGASVAGITLAL